MSFRVVVGISGLRVKFSSMDSYYANGILEFNIGLERFSPRFVLPFCVWADTAWQSERIVFLTAIAAQ